MLISKEIEFADVDSIDINETSLMQLLEYLTANKENDKDDIKKSKALVYFQNRLRQEIKSFRAEEENAVFFYIYNVNEKERRC